MAKWIKWEGGECPVATGTRVEVKHRDGDYSEWRADSSEWWPANGRGSDIVAYRLHAERNENPITHKALGRLHAKLDRIERKLDRLIGPEMVHGVSVVKDRPKWTGSFVLPMAKDIVSGKNDGFGLESAFDWSETAEGFYFWNDEDHNMCAGKPLSEDARTALTRMIAEYEASH